MYNAITLLLLIVMIERIHRYRRNVVAHRAVPIVKVIDLKVVRMKEADPNERKTVL